MKLGSLAPAAALLTAACQTPADPPSLLPRPVERQQTSETPITSPAKVQPADAALVTQLARLLADARAGDADFATVERSDAAALAAGQRAPQGSEAWISGEIARSALEAARQKSADALADIDSLTVAKTEQASRDGATGGLNEILSVQTEISAIVERQSRRLRNLMR
jgi:hypothetical protein